MKRLKKISNIKLIFALSLIFAIFIYAVPRLLVTQIPCLDAFDNANVEYNDCNLVQMSNLYLIFGFIGMVVTLVTFSLFTKMKHRKQLAVLGIVVASIFLYGYYDFLPKAENQALESSIFLDTFHEEYSGQ